MAEAFEFTFLCCYSKQGLIKAISPLYRRVQPEAEGATVGSKVLELRLRILRDTAGKGEMLLDGVLPLPGRQVPKLMPLDFLKAAAFRPDLAAHPKLRPYFEVPPQTDQEEELPQGRYALPDEGSSCEELLPVTLLAKDHLRDSYALIHLCVDEEVPALSVLEYLAEQGEGQLQPVAVFAELIEGARLESSIAPAPALSKPLSAPRKASQDPYVVVASTLLDTALEQSDVTRDVQRRGEGLIWLAEMLNSRKTVALVGDAPFMEQALLRAMRGRVKLPVVMAAPLSPSELVLDLTAPTQPSCIVLPMNAYPRLADPEKIAHWLAMDNHAGLIACQSLAGLSETIRSTVDVVVTIPRLDNGLFGRLFEAVFGYPPVDRDTESVWTRFVQIKDLVRIAREGDDPVEACATLRKRVEDRLTRLAPHHGPSLSDLSGLGEAKIRAEMLITDIRAALDGVISWNAVDRGMLLAGPPGCGKTSLARAIAKDCGVHFLECSAAKWQMAGYLNDHLAAMARDFQEARRYSPSIIFIDEMDSIGSRDDFTGSNASYSVQVVNALLAELQGFSDKEQVFVIGATNHLEKIDPALRRAGRLDRVIEVTLPTIDALEKIFSFYLEKHSIDQSEGSGIVLRPLAEAAFGRSGADVSLTVRGALRRARMSRRTVCQDDLLAELYNRPLQDDLTRPLMGEGLRRVALHEAGHAVLRLTCGGALGEIAYISVIPRPDGSLGFVSLRPNPDASALTRADYFALIDVTLGGRAAEEAFYGPDAVGAGAGGGENSDLAKAMDLALDMVCRLGLGKDLKLCWYPTPRKGDERQAEALLAEAYSRAKSIIADNRDLVLRIADLLVEKQELSGKDLYLLRSK